MTSPRPPRLGALDLLRGATVAAMIVVNNPGNWNAVYPELTHAEWNGVTVADLIFPAFIFIMGVAMQLSLGAGPERHERMRRGIVTRAAWLVAMGLVLNLAAAWPDPGAMRIPGVLQRIGLTYLLAALLLLHTSARGQIAWIAGLLAVHSAIVIAGGPLEPGVNVAAAIDRVVFGRHILSPSNDPEGLLGVITCVATALMGAAVGRWVVQGLADTGGRTESLAVRLSGIGLIGVVAGWALSPVLPLNKALWTASFAILTGGVATLGLALCLRLTNRRALLVLAPLFWLGTNPLAIYFASELTTTVLQWPLVRVGTHAAALKDLAYWDAVVPLVRDHGGPASSLLYGVAYTLLWISVAGVMKWRGIRVRV